MFPANWIMYAFKLKIHRLKIIFIFRTLLFERIRFKRIEEVEKKKPQTITK